MRGWVRLCALAGWVAACAGCSEFRGEASLSLCSDDRDNDGDDLVDCADPDCRAISRCGWPVVDEAGSGEDASTAMEMREPAPPSPSPPSTVEFPDEPMDMDADAGADPDAGAASAPGDAGPPPPADCADPCAADERCIAGQCKDADTHRYLLRLNGAVTPRWRTAFTPFDTGLDLISPWYLGGVQDVYVAIVVNDKEAARTDTTEDDLTPKWSVREFDLEITEGESVELKVWDYDGETGDPDLIFACAPPVLMLPSAPSEVFQPLGCESIGGEGLGLYGEAIMIY